MGLPAGSYGSASVQLLDAGNEKSSFQCWGKVITAANHDAQQALWATLVAKIVAGALGAKVNDRYAHEAVTVASIPLNGAMRETVLVVHYLDDTTGVKYTAHVPTWDPANISYIGGTDSIDLTSPTEVTDLIDAFEAFAVNPLAPTNTISVYKLTMTGRRA